MSERQLCSECHGDGVVKIYHGVSVCGHCNGECWEPPAAIQSRADALSDKLRLVRDALSLDLGDGVDVVDGARACREERDRLRATMRLIEECLSQLHVPLDTRVDYAHQAASRAIGHLSVR